MNVLFCAMMLAGIVVSCALGKADKAQQALLDGGVQAISLCFEMAGAYVFFGGLLGVFRESGVTASLAAALQKPMMRLFAFGNGEECALPDICVNLSAEMLGMGGAATPAGLSAMRIMAQANPEGNISRAMALFLVLNMCSVQLLPVNMIALRAQAGAANPADIVFPVWIVTGVSALTGILCCKVFSGWSERYG